MRRTAEEWANALDLRKSGREYVGPCPDCGGEDRFHIRETSGGGALVGCRGCIDGAPEGQRREQYKKIYKVAFGDDRPTRRRNTPYKRQKLAGDDTRAGIAAKKQAEAMIASAKVDSHPYLESKGFPNKLGLTLGDDLIIPVRKIRGDVMSVQRITPNGQKFFLKGGRTSGGCHRLGRGKEGWLCEGLATGLSVLEALRNLGRDAEVLVCFSATNLRAVNRVAKKHYLRFFTIADNDASLTGENMAKELKHPYWLPPEVGTDANDFHLEHGIHALEKELLRLVAEALNG